MHTKELCLGALLFFGDSTGYEIKQHFERTFSHFQTASYAAIYPALARLEKEGLVTCRVEAQQKRPDKKIYHLTEAGRRHFIEALHKSDAAESCRSDFILLMFFADQLDPQKLREILDQQETKLATTVEVLSGIRDSYDHSPGQRFTLDYGIAMNEAGLNFIRKRKKEFLEMERPDDQNQ